MDKASKQKAEELKAQALVAKLKDKTRLNVLHRTTREDVCNYVSRAHSELAGAKWYAPSGAGQDFLRNGSALPTDGSKDGDLSESLREYWADPRICAGLTFPEWRSKLVAQPKPESAEHLLEPVQGTASTEDGGSDWEEAHFEPRGAHSIPQVSKAMEKGGKLPAWDTRRCPTANTRAAQPKSAAPTNEERQAAAEKRQEQSKAAARSRAAELAGRHPGDTADGASCGLDLASAVRDCASSPRLRGLLYRYAAGVPISRF